MRIERIELTHVLVPLKDPFRISSGAVSEKDGIVVRLFSEGLVGYGEASPMSGAFYSDDTPESCWADLRDRLIPAVLSTDDLTIETFNSMLDGIEASNFAKTGVENALWDLEAKREGVSLARKIRAPDRDVYSGLAVGIYDTIPLLLDAISEQIGDGYARLKIKIQPGWDLEPVAAVREEFGNVDLFVDANAAYTLDHVEVFRRLDDFGLMMYEQPFAKEDIEGSAALARQVKTPICFDESAETLKDVRKAIRLEACRIVNIKIQRVGGLKKALEMNRLCEEHGIPTWVGTMPELGVGQAAGIALAALPNFRYPTDVEPSMRWYTDDVVSPFLTMDENGVLELPEGPGLGFAADEEKIRKYRVRSETFGK